MVEEEAVITHLDDLRSFADAIVHPVVSPDNWDVYSSLCDYIDLIKTEVECLLKEQDDVIPIKLVAEFLVDYAFPPTDMNAIVYHESKAEMEWEQFLRDLKGR